MVTNNKQFLETAIKTFFGNTKPKNIFVMGDFNDRYDAIKDITVNGMTLTYAGDSPYSCCHNWDSSCKNERYNKFDENYGYCKTEGKDVKTKMDPTEEGYTMNYRYKGDKVFGLNPVEDIQIYKGSTLNKTSVESDHQLVYASFTDPKANSEAGGRRRRRKSLRQNKRRASRRRRH